MNGFDDDTPAPDVEIVGLHERTFGRSCTTHECCGRTIQVGDVLRLVSMYIPIPPQDVVDGVVDEYAIKVTKIEDGVDMCTVGFIPRYAIRVPHVRQHVNKFVQVTEVYDNSSNLYKKDLSIQNRGMASAAFINELQEGEEGLF